MFISKMLEQVFFLVGRGPSYKMGIVGGLTEYVPYEKDKSNIKMMSSTYLPSALVHPWKWETVLRMLHQHLKATWVQGVIQGISIQRS